MSDFETGSRGQSLRERVLKGTLREGFKNVGALLDTVNDMGVALPRANLPESFIHFYNAAKKQPFPKSFQSLFRDAELGEASYPLLLTAVAFAANRGKTLGSLRPGSSPDPSFEIRNTPDRIRALHAHREPLPLFKMILEDAFGRAFRAGVGRENLKKLMAYEQSEIALVKALVAAGDVAVSQTQQLKQQH
ncbi:MAG: hypothetical protein WCP97_10130 [bacterium]